MYDLIQKTGHRPDETKKGPGKSSRVKSPMTCVLSPIQGKSQTVGGAVPRYAITTVADNRIRNRATADIIQMVPDLGKIAASRVIHLLQVDLYKADSIVQNCMREHSWIKRLDNDEDKRKWISNYYLQSKPQTLQNIGLALKLKEEIRERAAANEKNGLPDYIGAIRDYYSFESNVKGQDIGAVGSDDFMIDPNASATDETRKSLLKALIGVLENRLLDGPNALMREAIEARDGAREGRQEVAAGLSTPISNDGTVRNIKWDEEKSWLARRLKEDILGGAAQFNSMTAPDVPQIKPGAQHIGEVDQPVDLLPDITMQSTLAGAMTASRGNLMRSGLAVGPAQIVHEYGHHLENNLSVNDFAILHNFLASRSRSRNLEDRSVMEKISNWIYEFVNKNGQADDTEGRTAGAKIRNFIRKLTKPDDDGMKTVAWNTLGLPFIAKGYDAQLPDMKFQNEFSRHRWIRSNHSALKFLFYNIGNYALSLSIKGGTRLLRLIPAVADWLGDQRTLDERAQRFVDDFFLQDSNAESTSYATFTEETGAYRTEFLSTTAELFATERGLRALIDSDPLRAALFLYLANKPIYREVSHTFDQTDARLGNPDESLDRMIHVIR